MYSISFLLSRLQVLHNQSGIQARCPPRLLLSPSKLIVDFLGWLVEAHTVVRVLQSGLSQAYFERDGIFDLRIPSAINTIRC